MNIQEILKKHKLFLQGKEGGERANLREVDLNGADLSGADLREADLNRADLSEVDLNGADLSEADLRGANLREANLCGVNLYKAYLYGANLRKPNLRGANLREANLCGADLIDTDLTIEQLKSANTEKIKQDFFSILDNAKNEIAGLRLALIEGRISGSTYEGECACLVGTIANIRHCKYNNLENIKPNSNRPAERWFYSINKYDTPDNNPFSKLTVEWIDEYLKT